MKLKKEIIKIIENTVNIDMDIDDIKGDTKLQKDLGIDSLDSVEIVMAIEEKFEITIAEQEAERVKTISDLVDIVKKHKEYDGIEFEDEDDEEDEKESSIHDDDED
ncbi:MAG: acyl carrier protein [Caudoviricetes sp.]|nr:MAG: acyl carrier protein [Caudoviricetes sp.]